MSLKLGKPKVPPSPHRKDKERDMRRAVVEDADKTEDKDRDLARRWRDPRPWRGRGPGPR